MVTFGEFSDAWIIIVLDRFTTILIATSATKFCCGVPVPLRYILCYDFKNYFMEPSELKLTLYLWYLFINNPYFWDSL